ncbi:MAG: LysM peptidoglycan-binding domain-containing protein [Desulfobacula sp.]|nr:LysM peptidoglycan-binding domain-containing protein [Desulfobacula sp.]
MKPKEALEAKISTTKTNTNKKKLSEIPEGEKRTELSLLKKNEFAMILMGALLLTLIVFFFFFRTSDPVPPSVPENQSVLPISDLESRMEKIEQALQIRETSASSEGGSALKEKAGINPLEERVARLETAFSVKMDSMVERIGKIEKNISQLAVKSEISSEVPDAKPGPAAPAPEKKTVKKEKKDPIFHTVQKGETLFSISRKYNTSVETLRKINNLSNDAAIFPGNNILVR